MILPNDVAPEDIITEAHFHKEFPQISPSHRRTAELRRARKGPPFFKHGRDFLYVRPVVVQWVLDGMTQPRNSRAA